jgi:predicted transglutaminase-like cysteine proteinase
MTHWKGMSLLFAAAIGLASLATAAAASPWMKTGSRTTQPIGHYELCRDIPQECRQKTSKRTPVELTRDLWTKVVSINNAVNAAVRPRTDFEMWGREEVWSYPNGEGDCEDYALEKRRRLAAIGVPVGDLLVTVVRQRNGDGHAVLTMRTSLGDFVLDNLEARVLRWSETEYTYLKRQSTLHSGVWVSISDGRADAVASVK